MGLSVYWSCFAVLSCLLSLGCEVHCDCTEKGIEISGGTFSMTKNLSIGSLLVYKCPEDYYPYPDLVRFCQTTSMWTPPPKKSRPQRCKIVECPDPNVLENGNVSPPQERYFVHNETTYDCYSGHRLRGSRRRVCLPNGKWSGSTPICSRDSGHTCADPGIPAGAARSGNIFGFDDKVKYSCSSGLYLVGSKERVCKENGEWTGIEPACYYKHTYDTPLEVAEVFGNSVRETLTTLQSMNDTQQERKIRITKNGTLNIYIAIDISESIEEKYVNPARDALTKLLEKIASFSVTPNYDIVFFSSEIHEIVNILKFLDGGVQMSTVKQNLENFKVGNKNTAGTDLNLVFKKFLEKISFIRERTGEKFAEHRHVIILFSDGGYNMGGSPAPTVEKIKHIVYMNPDTVEGAKARAEYLDIYVFAIGAEIYDDDLQPLVTGLGGKHYFKLSDYKDKLREAFDEMIDESEVEGLCGLHKERDPSEDEIDKKVFPWWVYIMVNNEKSKKCLGSLVTSKFVLTAAHCFTFGDLPEHVTVEIRDGNSKEKRVKEFKLHPKYDINAKVDEGVKEFYDYDVALIQLEEDVRISSNVRPICIPCTKATNDALRLKSGATCKNHEEILLKNQLESLSFLTLSNGKINVKDVNAKLGDNRDECISHALNAEGITTKDPKVPVTDNFLCTGGRIPTRDHIACTGDSGGAVFKDHHLRTIQVALVSWGSKNMCKAGGKVESDDESRDFHINLFRVVPFLKSILAKDDQDDYAPLEFIEGS